MELRHVRYFVTTAEAGGVSRAALRLNISQPALSRQIRDLEAELDVRLFDRVGRRLELTAAGADLLARGRDLLAGAAVMGERAGAFKSGRTGVLRVGSTPQTLESVFPRFLGRYRRLRPGVEVQLREQGGPELLHELERGELHLAVTLLPDEPLRSRPLFPGRVLAVMSSRHPLRRRRAVEVADLAGEPLLLLRREFGTRQWLDDACRAARVGPRVLLESGAPHTLVALARAGHGIAIVPSTVRFVRKALHVAPVLHDGRSLGGWVAVSWDPRRFQPPYAEHFVTELVADTRRWYPGREFERLAPPVLTAGADGR